MGNEGGRHDKTEIPNGSILAVQLDMKSENNEENKITYGKIVLNPYNCHGGTSNSLYGVTLTLQKNKNKNTSDSAQSRTTH